MQNIILSPLRLNSMFHGSPVPLASAPPPTSPIHGSTNILTENRNLTVLRSPNSTPEMRVEPARNSATPQQYQVFQRVSPPLPVAHHSTSQHGLNVRREQSESRHSINRPSPAERR